MLLTLSTTHAPATDLGYLLHKSPHKAQSFALPFGEGHVFYPEATSERCTAALLLEVDPVALVRSRKGPPGEGGALEQYVNDRPYVASSFLSVALSRIFGAAMSGRSRERPELAAQPLPLTARLSVLPCRGGEGFLRRLFEPLGYTVTATRHALDETVPEWGASRYFTVTLEGLKPLGDLLSHLYVLVPVLDDDKHYWVTEDEIDKLLRHGEGWLAAHPEREAITLRYLRHQRGLAREALDRLAAVEEAGEPEAVESARDEEEATLERRVSLDEQRREAVVAVLVEHGVTRVVDVGCGEGKLLKALLKERRFTGITGMDVSIRALERAKERLGWERLPDLQRQRLQLLHGSLVYRDKRLAGYEAATVVEVIEHLDPLRLAAFERVLFEEARPGVVVLTTPNAEFNVRFEGLAPGRFRHRDHRFEWTRAELETWARGVAGRCGYGVRFSPVGPVDAEVGAPTQMAVFTR
ncbi:3' terminal RNA ribose 2'-O-methyltransferase Hen1 [Pyxidicoccus xibeiensis]|uniref:3' terminal RNA ribose 2'-O-methyltransferase Hen1 n=1 Tax=Pyxidicoccus xibeiensis TaxID=2906759 RepID=UPI0020A7A6AC|nr:3' terminal RNA ribose 2'-O-methyltransferase Hen1 [Pyxidicoccus xibeiensis]MCP3142670.1 3' terminal RNA ribose 2'-O-methyltransferase Hen1 [Pyxidicoccus xibeiensis]